MALLSVVVPALGLQRLAIMPVPRPATLLAPCAASRCAPPLASHGKPGEHWVDFDAESGDECLVSEAGSSCFSMEADVAGPIRMDGQTEQLRSRWPPLASPGPHRNFQDLSNENFRRPYNVQEAQEAQLTPSGARKPPDQSPPGFPYFSPGPLWGL
jgi:hypothetical protein